jgi:16S rRNA uridine-516 pseudouridylate synthase and related pseudouridylate synthases
VNIRISKYLSSAGICSRRDAEKIIVKKKIKINNQVCVHPSQKVSNLDIIKVNNKNC